MKSDIVAVTDHIKDFSIEKEFLGDFFEDKLSKKTTIILVWHENINENFSSNDQLDDIKKRLENLL